MKIQTKIKEQDLIESLLNMKHSEVTDEYILICLSFYAMSNRWHIDKLSYYLNLLEIKNERKHPAKGWRSYC